MNKLAKIEHQIKFSLETQNTKTGENLHFKLKKNYCLKKKKKGLNCTWNIVT